MINAVRTESNNFGVRLTVVSGGVKSPCPSLAPLYGRPRLAAMTDMSRHPIPLEEPIFHLSDLISARHDYELPCAVCTLRQRRAISISASVAPLLRAHDSATAIVYFAT
jgi:hypothetical protein